MGVTSIGGLPLDFPCDRWEMICFEVENDGGGGGGSFFEDDFLKG